MTEEKSPVEKTIALSEKGELPIKLRGKYFGLRELRIIHQCLSKHFERGRTYISKEICKELEWRQPNGWLKDRACRHVLLRLEEKGFVELPERLISRGGNQSDSEERERQHLENFDLETPATEMPAEIDLEFAKGNKAEEVWNEFVDEFHYLRHSIVVGRCLKYLVRGDGRLIGAISFSSPSWRLKKRDQLLGELNFSRDEIHQYVINNNRFLILPFVEVSNLASRVLSMATEKVVEDWTQYYALRPKIAETFVQPSRYEGTCYEAANWINVGATKGYAKRGRAHHNGQEPKQIYLYGLSRKSRRELAKLIPQQT